MLFVDFGLLSLLFLTLPDHLVRFLIPWVCCWHSFFKNPQKIRLNECLNSLRRFPTNNKLSFKKVKQLINSLHLFQINWILFIICSLSVTFALLPIFGQSRYISEVSYLGLSCFERLVD
jgi:hypothetical protein